jgi:pyruvate dehydrogenase E1 component alpha subunit
MPSVVVDGQDFFAIHEAAGEAVARARRGDGPTFIEAQTYRYYGHFEGDTIKYRNAEEEQHYRSLGCIRRFRKTVIDQGLLSQTELDTIDERARATVEDAVRFAQESQMPATAELLTDVYVSIPESQLWPFQRAVGA